MLLYPAFPSKFNAIRRDPATAGPAIQVDAKDPGEAIAPWGDGHHHGIQRLKIQAQPELAPSGSQRGLVLVKE